MQVLGVCLHGGSLTLVNVYEQLLLSALFYKSYNRSYSVPVASSTTWSAHGSTVESISLVQLGVLW